MGWYTVVADGFEQSLKTSALQHLLLRNWEAGIKVAKT